jgi:transposase
LSFWPTIPFTPSGSPTFVGRRCYQATINDVAKELHLDWGTVKELDKQYMRPGALASP